ncbi:uncharacterized protein N7479_003748 [Penicillium vulpinum]|uniref:Heterokaryon incompatibility domain-containing protein n=1 Tax=Penicillium vulpinum TaxID=29845 RepID=A0A1V6RSD6_9EURO|nr:uncharacterized protein N7479_003748 [Penicillium vulpinum]KAJ5963872.1 hypothetical protein N7479_003748 [Penicillium vulpinum]OQE04536.1 hypothetical protein PENVUL_c032G07017 [Penicillium vulpinum]
MEIYLVRVRERPEGSLYIDRKPHATTDDDYIAISHVWGSPDTVQKARIDGVSWEVPLSPGKQDILSLLRRDDICGDGWFWMDLFCIDQTESAFISISDQIMAIPSVYKSSRCVKVLLESPVCKEWHEAAMQFFENGPINQDGFQEEELIHGRSCTHHAFADPWFERLWTRQEGLYASVLHFIVLRPVQCERRPKDAMDAWVVHGTLLAHRFRVNTFLVDKLAYHGLTSAAEDTVFSLYFDVIYRHRVNITLAYDCEPGPARSYNPIRDAWRSQRSTTKPRDYVLAVFPDIEGYRVPAKPREMSFPQLLHDAINQPAVSAKLQFVSKISQGVAGPSRKAKKSLLPWLVVNPGNIGEAYDTFTADAVDASGTGSGIAEARMWSLPGGIQLQDVDATASGLEALIKDNWGRTADINRHVALLSPAGPCTGVTRRAPPAAAFTQEFMHLAVSQWMPEQQMSMLEPRTKGVLPAVDSAMTDRVGEDVFANELRRFLVCLICGVSLPTADRVLELADVVRVMTPHGPLLGVVHRATKLEAGQDQLRLLCSASSYMQGFYIGLLIEGGVSVRGRTVIANKGVWDSIESFLSLGR